MKMRAMVLKAPASIDESPLELREINAPQPATGEITYTFTYGSIGAVIILLLWFYLSGIAILVGGEVNSEIEKAADRSKEP